MCSSSKSSLIAANSSAIRESVCTFAYHSHTGRRLHCFPIDSIPSSKQPALKFSTDHFQSSSQISCPCQASLKSLGKFPLILIEQAAWLPLPFSGNKIFQPKNSRPRDCGSPILWQKSANVLFRFYHDLQRRTIFVCFHLEMCTSCVTGPNVTVLQIMHQDCLKQDF